MLYAALAVLLIHGAVCSTGGAFDAPMQNTKKDIQYICTDSFQIGGCNCSHVDITFNLINELSHSISVAQNPFYMKETR